MSSLEPYHEILKEELRERLAVDGVGATKQIKDLTGVERSPDQVRRFLKSLGLKRRKVGQIPAKVDREEQEDLLQKKLEPRIEEAKAGTGCHNQASHHRHQRQLYQCRISLPIAEANTKVIFAHTADARHGQRSLSTLPSLHGLGRGTGHRISFPASSLTQSELD